MAAKIKWHRSGTKSRHCRPRYTAIVYAGVFCSDGLSVGVDDSLEHVGGVVKSIHDVGRRAEVTQRCQVVGRGVAGAVDVRHHVLVTRLLRVDDQLRVVVQEVHLSEPRDRVQSRTASRRSANRYITNKYRLTELWLYVPLDIKRLFWRDPFPQANLLAWYGIKLNLTQQKHALTNQKMYYNTK